MLMVVFGAGASYDSVNPLVASEGFRDIETLGVRPRHRVVPRFRPPLAVELFEQRDLFATTLDKYNDCKPVVFRLRTLAASGGLQVEEELERMSAEAAVIGERRRQLAAVRFYLWDIIRKCDVQWSRSAHGVTNYLGLADTIRLWQAQSKEPVVFVPFNYDTMLESAWTTVTRHQFASVDDYIANPEALFVKVHGSVNWRRLIRRQHGTVSLGSTSGKTLSAHDLIALAGQLDLTGPIRHENEPAGDDVTGHLPAVAVPIRRKADFECPEAHLDVLASRLPSITRLLVIGWAGADEHFLGFCKSTLAPDKTLVVSGSTEAAASVARVLVDAGIARAGSVNTAEAGFSELVGADRSALDWLLA